MAIRGTYRISPVENRRLRRVIRILNTAKTLGYKMGNKQSKIFVILFLLLIAVALTSCPTFPYVRDSPFIGKHIFSDISWTENTIIISFSRTMTMGKEETISKGVLIKYKNIPIVTPLHAQIEEEWADELDDGRTSKLRVTMIVDLTDVIIADYADYKDERVFDYHGRVVIPDYEENEGLFDDNGLFIYHPTLFINEEATFEIWVGSGGVQADVFIVEGRIDILEQRSYILRWRY